MSDEQEQINSDTPTTPTYSIRANNLPIPLSPEQRIKKQTRFLKEYAQSGNIKHSCKVAGINRSTFYEWKNNDSDFQTLLPMYDEEANDTLEFAGYDRAVNGTIEPVVSQGQLVYEYEPMLDEKGNQTFAENGKPLMKRGKQVTVRKYSDTLLVTLLKARMPQKYRETKSVEMSGPNGGPIHTKSTVDLSSLSTEEIATLLAIAEKTEQATHET